MSLASGTKLGPYEIVTLLGAGGMGEVYRARDTRLNREVAIKVLPASFGEDADRLHRFQLEAQSAGALNHPNILAIYDVGTYEGSPYLVSELLEGESLRDRIQHGKIGVNKAVDYARQVAAGLAAAHSKGITHRDIKPENLFVTKDGRVKILDFGLAKVTGEKRSSADATPTVTFTIPGVVMGTAAYMSPEQARGQTVDHCSDIFSFGCVLYEVLTGERCFTGGTQADVTSAILTKEPEISSRMPPGLAWIVQRCLEKSPDERFESARDIGFALDAIRPHDSGPASRQAPKRAWVLKVSLFLTLLFAGGCALSAYVYFRPAPTRSFHRLTFRRGKIHAARFTPHGNGVVYSAQWESEPSEVFTAPFDSPGSRALGFSGTELRGISPSGELALTQKARIGATPFAAVGMLVRAPLAGGAARSIEDKIDYADWSADGKEMAVVRETDQGIQLEFPVGNILYVTAGYISHPRISPDGKHVAFLEHPLTDDNAGTVAVVDRAGVKKTLSREYVAGEGLAWSSKGDEIWFTAGTGAKYDLQAITLGGRQRTVYSTPVGLVLQDISRDGRVLITETKQRTKLMFHGAHERQERELSWLDWSLINDISRDGKLVAFSESGEGAGDSVIIYLRETNGAPPVSLGIGNFPVLSLDGRWVVTGESGASAVVIYPVGPGQVKRVLIPGFTVSRAGLLRGGKEIWFSGNEPSHGPRYYLTDLNGAKPRPITPEGVRPSTLGAILNDEYLAGEQGNRTVLYPVRGGQPQPLEGVSDEDRIAGWSDDGISVFVYSRNGYPTKVRQVDWKTGKQKLITEITVFDRAGMNFGINVVSMTGDGKTYAYSFLQELDELHLIEGLK
jgi:serine/threonine protein kinase